MFNIDFYIVFNSGFLLFLEKASECAALGCEYHCGVTHNGPRCYCGTGYEVAADGKTCKGGC